jgi:hypothetical protein
LDNHGFCLDKTTDQMVQIFFELPSGHTFDGVIRSDRHKDDVGAEVDGCVHLFFDQVGCTRSAYGE